MTRAVTGEVVTLAATERSEPRRRRSWTLAQKLAILKDAEASGDPMAVVARRHGMNANHLFIWRQKAHEGTLGRDRRRKRPIEPAEPMQFIDLGVVAGRERRAEAADSPEAATIVIELASGVRVRAGPQVTGEALRSALAAVKAEL